MVDITLLHNDFSIHWTKDEICDVSAKNVFVSYFGGMRLILMKNVAGAGYTIDENVECRTKMMQTF